MAYYFRIPWENFPNFIDKFVKKFSWILWRNAPKFPLSFDHCFVGVLSSSAKKSWQILSNFFKKNSQITKKKILEIFRNYFPDSVEKILWFPKDNAAKFRRGSAPNSYEEFSRNSHGSSLIRCRGILTNFVEEFFLNFRAVLLSNSPGYFSIFHR